MAKHNAGITMHLSTTPDPPCDAPLPCRHREYCRTERKQCRAFKWWWELRPKADVVRAARDPVFDI